MTLAAALLAAALFLLGWRLARIYPLATATLSTLREALAVMQDASRDDLEKERLVRQYAVSMLRRFAQLAALIAAVIGAPALLLLAMDALRVVEFGAVVALMSSWWFIAITGAGALAVCFIRR